MVQFNTAFVAFFIHSSSGLLDNWKNVHRSLDVLVNGGKPWRKIRSGDRFACVTLDWWPNDKYSSNPGAHYPWANASILNLKLSEPIFTATLEALAPVRLRVGGSLADQIYYSGMDEDEDDDPSSCSEPIANASMILGYGQGCISASRLDAVLALCTNTQAELIFGLNGLYGRTPAPGTTELWTGPWNSTNAEGLLRHILALYNDSAGPLVAIELGNEIDGAAGINAKLPPATYATDFVTLRSLINDIWPENGPMLVGPDSSGFSDSWWYPQFLGNLTALSVNGRVSDYLDAISWHLYLLGSGNSSAVPGKILDPTVLNSLATKCQLHHSTLASYAGNGEPPQFWLGEGGGAYGSGQDGSTNTFLSTFWFADSLGTLAAQGHDSFCRQALVGGNYALLELQEDGSFSPNPDFYTLVLWRALMGDTVLAAWTSPEAANSTSGSSNGSLTPQNGDIFGKDAGWARGGNGTQGNIRTYAHCARSDADPSIVGLPVTLQPGAVAVLLLNINGNSSSSDFDGDTEAVNEGSGARSILLCVTDALQQLGLGRGADRTDNCMNQTRFEWHLTADGSLESHSMRLNGRPLFPDPDSGALPLPLNPDVVDVKSNTTSPLLLAGLSAVFVVLPNAAAPACMA